MKYGLELSVRIVMCTMPIGHPSRDVKSAVRHMSLELRERPRLET